MTGKVHFKRYKRRGLSQKDFALIKKRLRVAEAKIRDKTLFRDQFINVRIKTGRCSSFLPTRGSAYRPHEINVIVDPVNYADHYRSDSKDALLVSYVHERHHAQRWISVGYGLTLAEALVSEGLAQVFEEEMGFRVSQSAKNLSKQDLLEVSQLARSAILDNNEPDDFTHHNYWFFGQELEEGQEPLMPWAGYSLGYALVSAWLEDIMQNKGVDTASKAVDTPAESILKSWLEKGNEVLMPWLDTVQGLPYFQHRVVKDAWRRVSDYLAKSQQPPLSAETKVPQDARNAVIFMSDNFVYKALPALASEEMSLREKSLRNESYVLGILKKQGLSNVGSTEVPRLMKEYDDQYKIIVETKLPGEAISTEKFSWKEWEAIGTKLADFVIDFDDVFQKEKGLLERVDRYAIPNESVIWIRTQASEQASKSLQRRNKIFEESKNVPQKDQTRYWYVQGDLAPSNIFYDGENLRVIDFGAFKSAPIELEVSNIIAMYGASALPVVSTFADRIFERTGYSLDKNLLIKIQASCDFRNNFISMNGSPETLLSIYDTLSEKDSVSSARRNVMMIHKPDLHL